MLAVLAVSAGLLACLVGAIITLPLSVAAIVVAYEDIFSADPTRRVALLTGQGAPGGSGGAAVARHEAEGSSSVGGTPVGQGPVAPEEVPEERQSSGEGGQANLDSTGCETGKATGEAHIAGESVLPPMPEAVKPGGEPGEGKRGDAGSGAKGGADTPAAPARKRGPAKRVRSRVRRTPRTSGGGGAGE